MKLNRLREQNSAEMLEMVQLEDIIKNQIISVQKNKKFTECSHLMSFVQQPPSDHLAIYNSSVNYHDQFWRTYLLNQSWIQRVNQMNRYVIQLKSKLQNIKNLFIRRDELAVKMGFKRRQPHQFFQLLDQSNQRGLQSKHAEIPCRDPQCQKFFSCRNSLNLHYRINHTDQRLFDPQQIFCKLEYNPLEEQKIKRLNISLMAQQQMVEINSCQVNALEEKYNCLYAEDQCQLEEQHSDQIKLQNSQPSEYKNQRRKIVNQIKHSAKVNKIDKEEKYQKMPVQTRKSKTKKKNQCLKHQRKTKKILKATKNLLKEQEYPQESKQDSIGSLEDIIQLDSSNQLL